MKFALVDNIKVEATKGAKGICPSCGTKLLAICGQVRINHWRHKRESNCDPWWENETEWHRSWKNTYPDEWQEISLLDEKTGEKHIADVRTNHDLVIEFQHSHIDPKERTSRENFYKNMVWIVDGTRLKRDYSRFLKGLDNFRSTNKPGFFIVNFPEECFPSAWLDSSVPVIFDFRGIEPFNESDELRNRLYCLYPIQDNKHNIVAIISRQSFIDKTIDGEWFNKKKETQKQIAKIPQQNKVIKRRRVPAQIYDPKKHRFVKRDRF